MAVLIDFAPEYVHCTLNMYIVQVPAFKTTLQALELMIAWSEQLVPYGSFNRFCT